jgi:hypothetical protein
MATLVRIPNTEQAERDKRPEQGDAHAMPDRPRLGMVEDSRPRLAALDQPNDQSALGSCRSYRSNCFDVSSLGLAEARCPIKVTRVIFLDREAPPPERATGQET